MLLNHKNEFQTVSNHFIDVFFHVYYGQLQRMPELLDERLPWNSIRPTINTISDHKVLLWILILILLIVLCARLHQFKQLQTQQMDNFGIYLQKYLLYWMLILIENWPQNRNQNPSSK